MTTETAKAKEVARARLQIRVALMEAHLAGLVEGIKRFAYEDDEGNWRVGPEFDSDDLDDALRQALEDMIEKRSKMLADAEAGPNSTEACRMILCALGVYGIQPGIAVGALTMVIHELLAGSRDAGKVAAMFDAMREAFVAEAPDTKH